MKYSAVAVLVAGCLSMSGIVGCSSTMSGNGSTNAVSAPARQPLASTDAQPTDSAGSASPSTSDSASEPTGAVSSTAAGSSTAGSSTAGSSATPPHDGGGPTTGPNENPPPQTSTTPVFETLTLRIGSPRCAVGSGRPTEPAILTWRVTNATGVAVGIDDGNFGDASLYPGASGTQELTNIQCTGSQRYTFDIWTTGGSGGRAHRQLSVTGPSGTPPPSPPAAFQQLTLQSGSPRCGSATNPTTAPQVLTWRVANATGVAVGIDDGNFGDASPYPGASGTQELTNIQCHGSQRYTFDIWTTGGTGGPAHRQLSVTGPA